MIIIYLYGDVSLVEFQVPWVIPGTPSLVTLAQEEGDVFPRLTLKGSHEIHLTPYLLVRPYLALLGAVNKIF